MRNNTGNVLFGIMAIMIVTVFSLSGLTYAVTVSTQLSKPSSSLMQSYEMNLLDRIAVDEFLGEVSEGTSSTPLTEDTNTEDYQKMLTEVFESMVDDTGRAKYLSPKIRVHETIYTDELSLERITEIIDAEFYEESVHLYKYKIDYENMDTILNFKTGDRAYLEPIIVNVSISNGAFSRLTTYSIKNVYAEFEHNDGLSIMMSINTDNSIIERLNRTEVRR